MASDIVYARASDIVFPGASAVSGPQKRTTTPVDVVFSGATKVSEPGNSHIGAPTEDDQKPMWDHDEIKGVFDLFDRNNDGYLTTEDLKALVYFCGPHMLLGRDGNEDLLRKFGPNRRIDFANFLMVAQIDNDNPLLVQEKFLDFFRTRILRGFVPGSALRKLIIRFHINFTGNEENEHEDDQKPTWDHDEIKGLFDLLDRANDGYIHTRDLRIHFGFHPNLDLLREFGPDNRIDFANSLKLVPQLAIEFDNCLHLRKKFLDFVRTRMRNGFVLGSALRKLVIRFHINITGKKNKESNREKIYESAKRLKRILDTFDEDRDGYLTTKEVKTFMRIWERELSLVHNIMNEVDAVWNGKIDFEDFLDLLEPSNIDLIRRTEALKLVPLLNRIFRLLDEDGDGYISSKEVDSFKHIWKTHPNEVENFTDQVDFFGKDNFDFPDFFNLFPLRMKFVKLTDLKEDPRSVDKLRYVFSLLDEDGDGCLCWNIFKY